MTTSEIPVKKEKVKKDKPDKPALAQQISVTPDGDFVIIRMPKKLIAKQLFSF